MLTPTQMRRQRSVLTAAFKKHQKGLLRYVAGKIGEEGLSEDLVQNTFLKTWNYLVRGGRVEIMEAFLYHILKALIIDEYRKRKTTSLDVLIKNEYEPSIDDTKRHIDAMDGEQVVSLIEKLPESYRKIMRMRYVQDLSLHEISLITGQSRNTIAVQTHRGMKKLKQLYKKEASSEMYKR